MIRWVCMILIIASSLTTEGLRRRFPRPSSLRRLHEDQCGSIVRIDCLEREVRKARLRPGKNAASRLPICVQLTDDQLLQKLKDVGGYNPIYVAINITEAKKFKDPRKFEKEKPTAKPKPTRVPDCNHRPTPPTTTTATPTTLRPTSTEQPTRPTTVRTTYKPKQYAQDEQHKEMSRMEELLKTFDDDEDDEARQRFKRNTAVNNCWLRGSYVDGSSNSRVHLCSECHVITNLGGDHIPQLINEVACGQDFSTHSSQAAHDDKCFASAGLCAQRVLRLPAMKRTGYDRDDALSASKGMEIYKENWVTATKDIRAGCKCEMYHDRANFLRHLG